LGEGLITPHHKRPARYQGLELGRILWNDLGKGKDKVVQCLTKHHAMKT